MRVHKKRKTTYIFQQTKGAGGTWALSVSTQVITGREDTGQRGDVWGAVGLIKGKKKIRGDTKEANNLMRETTKDRRCKRYK